MHQVKYIVIEKSWIYPCINIKCEEESMETVTESNIFVCQKYVFNALPSYPSITFLLHH